MKGVNDAKEDVKNLIDGKSESEILQLRHEIETQLTAGEGMDVDYWGAVLGFLRLASFKLVLRREQSRFMAGRDIDVRVLGSNENRSNVD